MNGKQAIDKAFDQFLADISEHQSNYADHSVTGYLTRFRERISAQIERQLRLIQRQERGQGKMLSLGGWPGIAPIILNRLTGVEITILDHPALMDSMAGFYEKYRMEAVAFDFAATAKTPLPTLGTFDLIECCQCIEHWNFSPVPLFKQLFSELLAPEGFLFLTVPNAVSLYRRLSIAGGRSPYPNIQSFLDLDAGKPGAEVAPHWHEYTRDEVEKLIQYCGGTVREMHTASYSINDKSSLPHRIYTAASNLHPALRENIEAVCQRQPT